VVRFTWDLRKASANCRKHGIEFHEAATVFEDPLSTTFPDEACSTREEPRFVTIGIAQSGRLLVVAHANSDDTVRIISARRATRHERKFYEQG
jgi:uncharacterized protein